MSTNENRRAGIEARTAVGKSVAPVTRHEVALQHYLAAAAYHARVEPVRPPVAAEDGHGSPARTRRKRAARSALTLGFTQRQIEVMRLITQGYDNRMISSELFLAEVTVKKQGFAVWPRYCRRHGVGRPISMIPFCSLRLQSGFGSTIRAIETWGRGRANGRTQRG